MRTGISSGRIRHDLNWGIWLLLAAAILALATLASVALSPAADAAPSSATVICSQGQSSLQAAFDADTSSAPFTITVDQPNCQMPISPGITMGAGLDITLNGRGLTLDGGGYTTSAGTEIIDIIDSIGSPSTLSLNRVTLQNAFSGVYESPTGGSNYAATVNLTGSTINSTYYGLYVAVANVTDSTFTDNGTADYPYAGTVKHSTFIDNEYAVYVVTNPSGSLPGDVTVSDSTITNSAAAGMSDGYGVYADGTATATNSTVSGYEYGIEATTANITGSTVKDNYCGIDADTTNVTDSTLKDNTYGIYATTAANIIGSTVKGNYYGVDAYTTHVSDSTLKDNTYGAYVYFSNVSKSTIQQNTVGIEAYASSLYLGDATVANSTFSDNGCGVLALIQGTDSATAEVSGSHFDGNYYGIAAGPESDCPSASGTSVTSQSVSGAPGSLAQPTGPKGKGNGSTAGAASQSTNPLVKPADVVSTPETISLSKSTITNSAADGIHTPENATVTNSTITNNGDDGINAGSANVSGSVISGNVFDDIFGDQATVTGSFLSDSAFGIHADTVNVTGSTITGNQFAAISGNNLTVVNSTISENDGDGINASNDTKSPTVTAVFATITGNGGTGVITTGPFSATATILAGNEGGDCLNPDASTMDLTDGGGNLSSDDSCGFSSLLLSQGGVSLADLALGPLADNGGTKSGAPGLKQTVPTISLGYGSLALNYVTTTFGQCIGDVQHGGSQIVYPGTTTPITTDERGVTRPQGSGCDSGAFEANVLAAPGPGTSTVVRQGYYAVIRVEAFDANGNNVSRRNLSVTSVELDGPNGQVIPFSHPFQFGRFSRASGYQLSINTRNLSKGSWALVIRIGGTNPTTTTVSFTVR